MKIFSSAVASPLVEARPKTPPSTSETSTPPPAAATSEDHPPPADSHAVPEVEKLDELPQKEKPLEPAVTEDTLSIEQDKKTTAEDQVLTVSEISKCQEDVSVSESNTESADILSDSVEKDAAKLEKDVPTPIVQQDNKDGLTSQNNTEGKEKSESATVETFQSKGV